MVVLDCSQSPSVSSKLFAHGMWPFLGSLHSLVRVCQCERCVCLILHPESNNSTIDDDDENEEGEEDEDKEDKE